MDIILNIISNNEHVFKVESYYTSYIDHADLSRFLLVYHVMFNNKIAQTI